MLSPAGRVTLKNSIDTVTEAGMFCPTSFTHMESQHLGPVGPPGGLVHRWAWRGCHRFLGAAAGDEGGKAGIWKERNLGGFSPRGLCPFHAMKGRKWGAQLPRAASPLKPSVFQVGESKEQEDVGKPSTAGLPHAADCLRPWLRQRMFSFIQIIFFQVGSKAWVCLPHTIEGCPPALSASHFFSFTAQCGSEFKRGLDGCVRGQFRGRSWVTSAVGNVFLGD